MRPTVEELRASQCAEFGHVRPVLFGALEDGTWHEIGAMEAYHPTSYTMVRACGWCGWRLPDEKHDLAARRGGAA